ncbi:MAG TPA: transferrin receptor-like dimerization domain-containing protein [Solirubrobacteraceae bacterium]
MKLASGFVLIFALAGCAAEPMTASSPAAPALPPAAAFPPPPPPPAIAEPPPSALAGYDASSVAGELAWETKLRALPSADRMRENMRRLSAHPHHVGSPYDKDNAEWILARFREAGLDAHIEEFQVLFPTPKKRVLEMVAPVRFTARLEEPEVKGDPTSGQKSEQLPPYNAYSVDGDVTGPLVFVGYGLPRDYEELDRLNVSVKGAIVLARYGESWRGVKPKTAAEHGAVGCILYSDPRDDGYFDEDGYPAGPMRSPWSVQRGSVADQASTATGDPLTPGVGSVPGAPRLSLADAKAITRIPVLPISYGDAQPLLAQIGGPMAPKKSRGGLPVPYRTGPGPARVHLVVQSSWDQKTLYDVIGRLPGTTAADEWILRGNHHDAWVNGAGDPVSGQVALLEEVRALGELTKQGWHPRRTIVFAAWDGEEPGLLGSTEWGETHGDDLRRHAAVYVNTDGNGRGVLHAGGSHSLERVVNAVERDVPDPEAPMSVFRRKQLSAIAHADTPEDRAELRDRADVRLSPLGGGSDYVVFLEHLGVASVNLGFGGEDPEGVYHSVYDDFAWYTRWSDGDFRFGRALAGTAGTLVMRLADAAVLPLDFAGLADAVTKYQKGLEKELKKKQDEMTERNRELDDGVFRATYDPHRSTVAPPREAVPPFLNFAPLENAAAALKESARRADKAMALVASRSADPKLAPLVASVNRSLVESERRLTSDAGQLGRPWYRHMLYAPGVYAGYESRPIPGVAEGIEQKHYAEAEAEVVRAAAALRAETALLDAMNAEIEGALRAPP